MPDGSWEMLVVAGDSATASAQVTVPGDAGRIELAPGGGLHVDVPDLADGRSWSGRAAVAAGEPVAVTLR